MFQTLERQPAYQAVSERIRRAILSGEIAAGELLPTEADLCTQFGVTRSTIREAIRLLEYSGLLGRADRKRLVVKRPSTQLVGNSLSQAMQMHQVSFKDVWEVAMGLEPMVAELAATAASAEDKARLEANLQRTTSVVDKPEALLESEIEFHNILAESTGNPALLMARAPLNELFYPAFGAVVRAISPGKRILTAHQHICTAVLASDPAGARSWMEKHMVDFRRGIEMAGLAFDAPVQSEQWSAESA